MTRETREVIKFILKLLIDKHSFFLWFIIRFVSALFPLLSIFLYSRAIKMLEIGADTQQILSLISVIIFIFVFDNFTRLISIFRLDYLISNTQFAIHRFLSLSIKVKKKSERHAAIQAIRNFSDAVGNTLQLIRQPGIDSLVSLFAIPIILFVLDFKVFVIEIAYILIYYITDLYTTEKYAAIKDVQDKYTETYYAKLQDTNDVRYEVRQYSNQFNRLCFWGFYEWFTLQNIAVTFYTITLLYLIYSVSSGSKHISDLVLIIGYVAQTQTFLNSLSNIKDTLADTRVALTRLAKSKSVMAVDLDDLMLR